MAWKSFIVSYKDNFVSQTENYTDLINNMLASLEETEVKFMGDMQER